MKKKGAKKSKKEEKEIERRPPIEDVFPHHFWLEKYGKMEHFCPTIFNHYVPNFKELPASSKFYSKYGEINNVSKDYGPSSKYYGRIKIFDCGGPRERYGIAVLESHLYGWLTEPMDAYDKYDYGRLFRPIVKGELSDYAEKLSMQKITQRPPSNGGVFKLF